MIKRFKQGSYRISALAIIAFVVLGAVTLSTAITPTTGDKTIANDKIKSKLIVIDPGHGGLDLGATYPTRPLDAKDTKDIQVKEKDINLAISLELYKLLKASGFNVAMTRQQDQTLTFDERIAFANSQHASLLISIHNDSYFKSSANGTSTYCQAAIDGGSNAITGERAAQIIQSKLVKELGTTDQGVRKANLRILKYSKMPAVLTEIAFITNESDRKKLMSEDFRKKAAQALYDGIVDTLNEMVSDESKATPDLKSS